MVLSELEPVNELPSYLNSKITQNPPSTIAAILLGIAARIDRPLS